MNILFWADGFWPRIGGMETQLIQLVGGMKERGHQCRVVAQKDKVISVDEEFYEGIPIRRFDFNSILEKKNLSLLRSIESYLEEMVQSFSPDLIHLNGCDRGSALAFLLLMQKFFVPAVITIHAPYLQGKNHQIKLSPIIEQLAPKLIRICCVSNWVAQEMKKYHPSLTNKIGRIYNGLKWPNRSPDPLSFSPPIFLLFGRLSWEKGFDTAIVSFSLLKKRGSNARLIVAGDGGERQALETLARDCGVADSVSFMGVLSEEERMATLNRATVVIVPSILESFGLVILESMQMGRPVIASRTQGIPEVVEEGVTGLLVLLEDSVALSEAMETLLEQPELAIKMGAEGRKRAQKFSLEENLDQYEQLFYKTAGQRHPCCI